MPTFDFICPKEHRFEAYLHKRDEENPPCHTCLEPTERIWATTPRSGFQSFPFTTTHITGEPLEIRSPGHLREVEKTYKVRLRDDVAFSTQEYEGYDWGSRQQRYRESPNGLPGRWV